jgi:hypothetical protein
VLLRVDSTRPEALRAFGGTGGESPRGRWCDVREHSSDPHTRMALDASMLQQFEMMLQALL